MKKGDKILVSIPGKTVFGKSTKNTLKTTDLKEVKAEPKFDNWGWHILLDGEISVYDVPIGFISQDVARMFFEIHAPQADIDSVSRYEFVLFDTGPAPWECPQTFRENVDRGQYRVKPHQKYRIEKKELYNKISYASSVFEAHHREIAFGVSSTVDGKILRVLNEISDKEDLYAYETLVDFLTDFDVDIKRTK